MISLTALHTDKPALVFGLGVSGMASVKALVKAGFDVHAWDDNEARQAEASALGATSTNLETDMPQDAAFLVLAPGVPLTHPEPHPVVIAAQNHGIEILSDIELLSRATPNTKTIGITGTNGKSTTTALIGHILKSAGRTCAVGGNLGTAALALDHLVEDGIYVLELSSYQIDLCPTFTPDIGILLNITPDHLDRHGGIDGYAAAKARIFGQNTRGFIGIDDEHCRNIKKTATNMMHSFSVLGDADLCVKNGQLVDNGTPGIDISDLANLRGDHNAQNVLAAYGACWAAGLEIDEIENGLKTFPGLKHRQNTVAKKGKVTFINDSKATNDEASAKALSSFENIFWIVGGQAKGAEYPACLPYFDRVQKSYVIGEDTTDLETYLSARDVKFTVCKTLDKALENASHDAQNFDNDATVLLSPAAASWDQYASFEKRGEAFETLVKKLN